MKLLFINLLITLLFITHIGAQRARTSSSDATSEAVTRRSRGRTRFIVPSDISETDVADAATPIERQTDSVRKVDRKITRPSNKPYEVKEVLDDIPNTNVRKLHKPRVITETRFEAANAPKKPLYVPLPLPEEEVLPEDLLPNFSSQTTRGTTEKALESVIKETTIPLETSSQSSSTHNDVSTEELLPITTNLGRSPDLTTLSELSSTENEIKKLDSTTPEIRKKQSEPLQIVTPVVDLKKASRLQPRPRVQSVSATEETISSTVKTRVRTRPARRQETDSSETSPTSYTSSRTRTRVRQEVKNDDAQTVTRPVRPKATRRRLDIAEVTEAGVRSRVPSLFSAENTQEVPLRARTGRKVNYPSANGNENVLNGDRRQLFRRRSSYAKDRTTSSIETETTTASTAETQSIKDIPRNNRRGNSRSSFRSPKAKISEPQKQEEKTTTSPSTNRRSAGRSRKVDKKIEKNVEVIESGKIERSTENANRNEEFASKPARGRSIDIGRAEKQVVNINKNEVVFPPKASRSRPYIAEKVGTTEDPTELLKSRNKLKQEESEITTTTTTSTSTTIPSSTIKNNRRVEYQYRSKPEIQSESKVQERLVSTTQNIVAGENRRNTGRSRVDTRRNKPVQQENKPFSESITTRNDNRRRNFSRKTNNADSLVKETSTEARETFRSRSRTRFLPPIIDEQKLEVLPLFESEVKTVAPIRRRLNTLKENLNADSSSEHQIKVGNSNEILSDSPKSHTIMKSEQIQLGRNGEPIIKESVETKVSEVVTKRKIGRHVVRKVKVNKPNNNLSNDSTKPNKLNENEQKAVKVTSNDRGHKRAEFKDKSKNLSALTSSEEDIGDSDNYPEPFKALIQAKLTKKVNNKGSRSEQKSPSNNDDTITKSTERIVTSSRIIPIAASTSTTTTSIRTTTTDTPAAQTTSSRANNDENELVPNTSTTSNSRPTRRRFSLTTKYPEAEDASARYTKRPSFSVRKVTRSTVVPSHVSVITEVSSNAKKQSRYHARFSAASQEDKSGEKNLVKSSEKEVEIVTSTPKSRSFSPKPPRGLYSSRNGNNKKRTGKLDSPLPSQQANANGAKKANRFSARYRSDLFSRSGSTRPTHAPAYIPTVPTVTPPSVKSGVEDKIAGMEVISIDDPVNTIQSDSLINGELLSPSNPYNPSSKLVPASLVTKDGGSTTASPIFKSTEKPVSIIERIIYSITAISTASPDVNIDLTNDGPTKASAILKIPSKTNKEDLTFDISAQQQLRQQTVTNEIKPLSTEKPTTVIERILSSISAIQASSTEGTDTQGAVLQNSVATNDASPRVAAAEPTTTTNAPPTATLPAIAEISGGTPATDAQTVAPPQVGNKSRDVEEVNIEENTISNNGNNRPEKIVERTTTSAATTAAPRAVPTTVATTTIPIKSESIVLSTTEAPVPTTAPVPMTTPLAAIRIDDLTDTDETTIPLMEMTTNIPNIENRLANTEVIPTTTQRFVAARFTNTPTTVSRQFENLQLTITPTTPYLIQRIIGNITGTPVRLGGETTSMVPVSTITTEVPTTQALPTTTPTTARPRVRITTPLAITAPLGTTTEVPITTQLPTTTFINRMRTTTQVPITTTFRNRGRNRFSMTTPYDSFAPTVTVTPSTISTDNPISTTFIPRRYTQTPTTINLPSRFAAFVPTTDFSNIPTITEENFPQTTFESSPMDTSTMFPIYTTPFRGTDASPVEVTQQPTAADTTTNTPPTFAATLRPRQRTTTPMTTQNLQRLAELRATQNYGEISTTSDYFSSTTVTPEIPSSTNPTTLQTTLKTINSKVRQLTDQQRRDLEELTRLEKEQQAILQQLAFLTRLNLAASPKPTRSPSNLAGRVLDFAAERNKEPTTQSPSSLNLLEALTRGNSKPVQDKNPSVEEVLKQLNSKTVSPLSSTYGKSPDAILAALLKEQGIEPNTPKSLGDQLKTTTPFVPTTTTIRRTTTRRRVTTTARPGPIMQGLNWLLNALAPQPTTTKKPAPKKKVTPATTSRINLIPQDVEIISSQPTEITPVFVTAPPRMRTTTRRTSSRQSSRSRKPLHSLSEDELQILINQLETAQKDPSKVREIDFASLGFTQTTPKSTTLVSDNAVQITNSGKVGTSSKLRIVSDSSAKEAEIVPLVYNRGKATTAIPSRVSNSIIDDVREETTTTRPRLPPLQLNPVPGIDDGDGEPRVRGQLISAAVNVTRAISQFLGSAIQGAAQSFQSFIGSGSRQVGNYFSGSSISNNRPG